MLQKKINYENLTIDLNILKDTSETIHLKILKERQELFIQGQTNIRHKNNILSSFLLNPARSIKELSEIETMASQNKKYIKINKDI